MLEMFRLIVSTETALEFSDRSATPASTGAIIYAIGNGLAIFSLDTFCCEDLKAYGQGAKSGSTEHVGDSAIRQNPADAFL